MNTTKLTPVHLVSTWYESGYCYLAVLSIPDGDTLWGYSYNTRNDLSGAAKDDCLAEFLKENNFVIVWDNSPEEESKPLCLEIIDSYVPSPVKVVNMRLESYAEYKDRLAQEAQSINLDQVPYDANAMEEIYAANAPKVVLTPVQEVLLGEQLEYWKERFFWADMRADYDACEFCSCYVVALEAIFGVMA